MSAPLLRSGFNRFCSSAPPAHTVRGVVPDAARIGLVRRRDGCRLGAGTACLISVTEAAAPATGEAGSTTSRRSVRRGPIQTPSEKAPASVTTNAEAFARFISLPPLNAPTTPASARLGPPYQLRRRSTD